MELLHAVGQSDGELFGEKLRCAEQCARGWFLAELHHLPEGYACPQVSSSTQPWRRLQRVHALVAGKLL